MSLILESTFSRPSPVERWEQVQQALTDAARPPHPWVTLSDEWGNLLRVEGLGGTYRLESRVVDAGGVRWFGLGTSQSPGTQVALQLSGRSVKVAPTERLEMNTVEDAFRSMLDTKKLPPNPFTRGLSGDHMRMYLMVIAGDDPRPALGWTDIKGRIDRCPSEGALVAALSEPGRTLIGVLGDGDEVTVTVQETRDERCCERRIGHIEGSGEPVELQLESGSLRVPKRTVLSRGDALCALESLYRFDAPPPGFTWSLVQAS